MPEQTILPGSEFTSVTEYDLDGAVGTLQFRVVDKATGDVAIDWAPSAIVQLSGSAEGPPWLYEATRDGITTPGTYRLQWRDEPGDPARQWTDRDELIVAVTIPPTLPSQLTLPGLKRRLAAVSEADDDKLLTYLAAALEQAQASWPNGCGRLLISDPLDPASTPVQRTVRVRRGRAIVPDASEITQVTIDGAAITGYDTLSKDGYVVQLTGLPADATSAVLTGRFGFTALPENLIDAIYVLAARMHYEEAAQYADQVEILEGTAVQSYYRQLPPRTKMVFATFMVPTGIVGLA